MRRYGGATLDDLERGILYPRDPGLIVEPLVARVRELEGLVKETLWAAGIAMASGDPSVLEEAAAKADAALAEEP